MPTRDDPFDELERLFDRLGEQFETGTWNREWRRGGGDVAVDVVDEGDAYVVTADLPGHAKDDIDVELTDSTLRIRATREQSIEEENVDVIRRGRTYGERSAEVRVPAPVDESGVSATYDAGVLEVTLPKVEEGGGTQIDVE